jgi:hypothetical protein
VKQFPRLTAAEKAAPGDFFGFAARASPCGREPNAYPVILGPSEGQTMIELVAIGDGHEGSSERRSDAVLVGALLLYGSGQIEDARETVRVLASRDTARAAPERQARRYFRLPAFSLPID